MSILWLFRPWCHSEYFGRFFEYTEFFRSLLERADHRIADRLFLLDQHTTPLNP